MNSAVFFTFIALLGGFSARAADSGLCSHDWSQQRERLNAFEQNFPGSNQTFAYTSEQSSPSPLRWELKGENLEKRKALLEQGAAFTLIDGEESLLVGISHSMARYQNVRAAGDLQLVYGPSPKQVLEARINTQSGGYFQYAKNADGTAVTQQQIIGSAANAIRALWNSGIYPEKIKIFYFGNGADPRFSELVFEI